MRMPSFGVGQGESGSVGSDLLPKGSQIAGAHGNEHRLIVLDADVDERHQIIQELPAISMQQRLVPETPPVRPHIGS
jgi:hypothetical protein